VKDDRLNVGYVESAVHQGIWFPTGNDVLTTQGYSSSKAVSASHIGGDVDKGGSGSPDCDPGHGINPDCDLGGGGNPEQLKVLSCRGVRQ
jgi:hypothetical protein